MKLFVRDLTVIDASYLCAERGMVGESWLVDIELSGSLNEMSMLLDFGRVKKSIKAIIDQTVDHRLLVPATSPLCRVDQSDPSHVRVDFLPAGRSLHLNCPAEAFCFIPAEAITREHLTDYLLQAIGQQLPDNIAKLGLTLRHEALTTPYYHYSHGLKKHDGNCQRIAHGHRSMIELWVDGVRDPALEQQWAERWQDIYLGSREDLVAVESLALSELAGKYVSGEHYGFRYCAAQGEFQLAIPKSACEILDTDTTVELLADYITQQLAPQVEGKSLQVVAYEGVGKGAIAGL